MLGNTIPSVLERQFLSIKFGKLIVILCGSERYFVYPTPKSRNGYQTIIVKRWWTFDVPIFFGNVPELSRVSRKNSQVSRFPAKSPDSRNNFGFVPRYGGKWDFQTAVPVRRIRKNFAILWKNMIKKRSEMQEPPRKRWEPREGTANGSSDNPSPHSLPSSPPPPPPTPQLACPRF